MTPTSSPPPATAEWFYADARHQQQGPVDHEALLDLLKQGQLRGESLVWKAGMEKWQPLHTVLALPPQETGDARFSQQDANIPAPAPAASVPPRHNKGCLIALVVALVLGLLAIPVIGILAAIAIPAYQDYTLRAQIASTLVTLSPYQQSVAAFYAEHGRCPVNGEASIPERDDFPEPHITDVYIGIDTDEGRYECIIAPTLTGFGNPRLDYEELWLAYDADNGEWLCGSSLANRILPSSCKNPDTP
ncbi:MAG: GYF domain-containing protein [Pseudomonadota bacterium]|nr:GYF domain-containing protein [Pseudomonadota bacterium]